MKKNQWFITAFCVVYFFLLAASAYAIDPPVPICPRVPIRQAGPYYSPRVPTFSWTLVDGASRYLIKVFEVGTPTPVISQWVEAGSSWTPSGDNELTPGTEYYWRVRAWNETDGHSAWSHAATFTAGKLKIMAINANDFVPTQDGFTFERYPPNGAALVPSDDSSDWWSAPVNLPQGSVVDHVRFYYYNDGAVMDASECYLVYSPHDYAYGYNMAYMEAGTTSGYGNVPETSISQATIDNSANSYFLDLYLHDIDNGLVHVIIGYWD